jgi:hypothetical protein
MRQETDTHYSLLTTRYSTKTEISSVLSINMVDTLLNKQFQQMTIQRILFFVTLVLSVTLIGCSGVRVSGKVTYEDGSPLTVGTIIFDDGTANFRAAMQNDGSYALGVTKDAQRIPSGDYKVWFASTMPSETDIPKGFTIYYYALPDEYTSVRATPLTANVTARSRKFDFVVPPPKHKVIKIWTNGRQQVIE